MICSKVSFRDCCEFYRISHKLIGQPHHAIAIKSLPQFEVYIILPEVAVGKSISSFMPSVIRATAVLANTSGEPMFRVLFYSFFYCDSGERCL